MINITQSDKKCQDAGFGYFIEKCLYYSADIVVLLFDIKLLSSLHIRFQISVVPTKQCFRM